MILFKEEEKMKKRSKEWISRFEATCKDMGIDINQPLWRGVDLFAIAEKMNCQPYVIMYYLKYERR